MTLGRILPVRIKWCRVLGFIGYLGGSLGGQYSSSSLSDLDSSVLSVSLLPLLPLLLSSDNSSSAGDGDIGNGSGRDGDLTLLLATFWENEMRSLSVVGGTGCLVPGTPEDLASRLINCSYGMVGKVRRLAGA